MKSSNEINELAAGMAAAMQQIEPPTKNKTADVQMKNGGKYKFSYADLAEVLESSRKALAAHGVTVVQGISLEGGKPVLETRVMHKSGQWIESTYPLNFAGGPQERGSELTYARRYALCAMLGIAAEDDDGNGAQGNKATITDRRPAPQQPQQQQTTTDDEAGPDELPPAVKKAVADYAEVLGAREGRATFAEAKLVLGGLLRGSGYEDGEGFADPVKAPADWWTKKIAEAKDGKHDKWLDRVREKQQQAATSAA